MTEFPSHIPLVEINKILHYLMEDERRDYFSSSVEAQAGHIYRSVYVVARWAGWPDLDDPDRQI